MLEMQVLMLRGRPRGCEGVGELLVGIEVARVTVKIVDQAIQN